MEPRSSLELPAKFKVLSPPFQFGKKLNARRTPPNSDRQTLEDVGKVGKKRKKERKKEKKEKKKT